MDFTKGTVSVSLELTGEGYSDYKISTETQNVEVKANIDYKKVDVKEEIKTEAEVNAAVEDTAVAEVSDAVFTNFIFRSFTMEVVFSATLAP